MVIDFSPYDDPRNLDTFFAELWRPNLLNQRGLPYPPVNIKEDEAKVIVTAEIPGLSAHDLELTLQSKSLTIKGTQKTEAGTYYRQERPTGTFQRVITLSAKIREDEVKASMKDGILRVLLPKAPQPVSRAIAISCEEDK